MKSPIQDELHSGTFLRASDEALMMKSLTESLYWSLPRPFRSCLSLKTAKINPVKQQFTP